MIGESESFPSSDEEFVDGSLQESGLAFLLRGKSGSASLDPALADGSESEADDGGVPGTQPPQRESYSTTV